MSAADELLRRNAAHVAAAAPLRPSLRVAVVTCMDARVNPYALLGLAEGEAHVLRNAGGVVTDDVLRSLTVSQRQLGTREVVLVHHSDCGMQTITEDGFRGDLLRDAGLTPPWAVEAFADLEADVRQCMLRIRYSPFLPYRESVRGFVYDVATGRLHEVG